MGAFFEDMRHSIRGAPICPVLDFIFIYFNRICKIYKKGLLRKKELVEYSIRFTKKALL